MHQQSRHPPRVSSPASSPQTNPTRTNNPRNRVRAAIDTTSQDGGSESAESFASVPSKESIRKLDQIIQNFYNKAAVVILQSRLNTTPVGGKRSDGKKTNHWFSLDTDDIEDFRDELRVYKQSGSFENRPPPLIIETYIDASKLSSSQSLVLIDDGNKRWDVMEALNSSESSDDSPRKRHASKRNTEVILERWRLELKCLPDAGREEFGPILPTVYKRSIVFFRALFMTTRVMPCWKYSQQALGKGINPALEVKCRILTVEPEYTTYDPLRLPLHDGRDHVTEYVFTDLEVPVGRFYASVTYRNDCNFRVDDAESLLSSRFMGFDENYFRPSVPQRREQGRSDSFAEPGSLPSQRQDRGVQGPQQTYGSLSTFHGAGALGTSPITALRSVRPVGSDSSSPSGSMSASIEQSDPPHSLPIRGAAGRPPVRPYDAASRRPSVSFQPFKAGSLSGSPRIPDMEAPSSPQSLTRPGLAGPSRTGNRSSLTIGMAASLRGGPSAPQEVPSLSASPRPTGRYSSSFTHRRGRPSFGGQSKGDDDQASSGKQSLSSSAQPGSGLLTEAGGVASSGSFAADDDNISEFLKALDSRKTLKSFEPNKKGESLASKRTAAQLSKFQSMRETNNVLTDSMTSSIHLQRSSSSSSRQLTNVPSMVNPASMSVSSSPGKPLSPHTPHTPAIPSRLSENSIIDYQAQDQAATARRHGGANPNIPVPGEESEIAEEEDDEDETPMVTQQDAAGRSSPTTATTGNTTTNTATTATAIDIPLSPRLLLHGSGPNRRASSVAHQHQQHHVVAGEAVDVYQRSASVEGVSADGREVPSLSSLLAYQREGGLGGRAGSNTSTAPSEGGVRDGRGRGDDIIGGGSRVVGRGGGGSGSGMGLVGGRGSVGGGGGSSSRGLGVGRYASPSVSASASASGKGGRPGSFSSVTTGRGARYAGSVEGADEEPLVFAMSELERESRRSLDEGGQQPGGSGSGQGGTGAGGGKFEPRGIQRKGW
ncbi:hypothetical protein N657DRAFT_588592 [Parathielavia appendiculata]|uniref:Autophagy-related protein 13 n=1 Tax=Parathielavia appendiculata TaxID=2587402 RepID=A0AAN6U8A5_9PEZI|nr:hypothetical protein N657DRAFT_588592 [Parathielavia appendiculata]